MRLILHVFADGRCVLSTERLLTQETVDRLKAAWKDWIESGETFPLLIMSEGIVKMYEMELSDEGLEVVKDETGR